MLGTIISALELFDTKQYALLVKKLKSTEDKDEKLILQLNLASRGLGDVGVLALAVPHPAVRGAGALLKTTSFMVNRYVEGLKD